MESRVDATRSSAVAGGGDAISAGTAEECNCVWGQGLTGAGETLHVYAAREATERELSAWEQVKAFKLLQDGSNSKSVVNTRRGLT